MTAKQLAFRITTDDDAMIEKIFKDKKVLICKEKADSEANCGKIHYHGILYDEVVRVTLRNWIINNANDDYWDVIQLPPPAEPVRKPMGNKYMAITTINEDKGGLEGMERYVCKGLRGIAPEIILNTQGVDTTQRNNEYWSLNASYNSRSKGQSYKKLFIETFQELYHTPKYDYKYISKREIVGTYLEFLQEHQQEPTPPTSMKAMITGLYINQYYYVKKPDKTKSNNLIDEMMQYCNL